MALRSVVLAPPPGGAGGPRRTVVLRPGGPKDKGKAADVLTLLLGVLLLASCVVLLQVLPNKEYALPQFQVTFPETPTEIPSNGFDFTEQEAARNHEFAYDFPDNVHSVTMTLFFRDENLPASLPDQFRVELFDPSGTPVGPRTDFFSAPPQYNSSAVPPVYMPGEITNRRLTIPLGLHPEEQIVQGLSHEEVAEQVRARLAPQYHLPTAGTWTVRVTLVNAGDCPATPGAQDTPPEQFVFCRSSPQPNDGNDPGNRFTIESLVFTTYAVDVDELS